MIKYKVIMPDRIQGMPEIKKGLEKVVKGELERAIDRYGKNHSRHEGYAVMREEYDEMMEGRFDPIQIWRAVKKNERGPELERILKTQRAELMHSVAEAVQVIAMLDKMIMFEEENME